MKVNVNKNKKTGAKKVKDQKTQKVIEQIKRVCEKIIPWVNIDEVKVQFILSGMNNFGSRPEKNLICIGLSDLKNEKHSSCEFAFLIGHETSHLIIEGRNFSRKKFINLWKEFTSNPCVPDSWDWVEEEEDKKKEIEADILGMLYAQRARYKVKNGVENWVAKERKSVCKGVTCRSKVCDRPFTHYYRVRIMLANRIRDLGSEDDLFKDVPGLRKKYDPQKATIEYETRDDRTEIARVFYEKKMIVKIEFKTYDNLTDVNRGKCIKKCKYAVDY